MSTAAPVQLSSPAPGVLAMSGALVFATAARALADARRAVLRGDVSTLDLGGVTAAVVVRWSDGTVQWATIPLPPDWPASPAGEATEMLDPLPQHLSELVGS